MSNAFEVMAEIQSPIKESLYVVPIFEDGYVINSFLRISSKWQENSKPVYLSLLMNEKQLLSIVNNKHLFDSEMVSAAYALLAEYEKIDVVDN